MYSTDVDITSQVYARRKDFDRSPQVITSVPNLLQGSVSTVTGADWQRQRRITAHPFNEQNMTLVWAESLLQAAALCNWWERNTEGFNTSCADTMTVALNVLATSGLGQSWRFQPSTSQQRERRDASEIQSADYRDTLATLLSSMNILALTPDWLYDLNLKYVPLLPLPKAWRDHLVAAKRMRTLMRQMVEERRIEFRNGKIRDNIFLNSMIAESEASVTEKGGGLSDGEVFGNMFAYSVAGHETTAHTLNYTLHLLSAYPKWQDWIQAEVDKVYQDIPTDTARISYAEYYPRLKRCIALMVSTPLLMTKNHSVKLRITDRGIARGSPPLPASPGSQQAKPRSPRSEDTYRWTGGASPSQHKRTPQRHRMPHDARVLGSRLPRVQALPVDQERAKFLGGVRPADRRQGGIHSLVVRCPHLPREEVLPGRIRRYHFLCAQALPSRGDFLGGRDAGGYSGQSLGEHEGQ